MNEKIKDHIGIYGPLYLIVLAAIAMAVYQTNLMSEYESCVKDPSCTTKRVRQSSSPITKEQCITQANHILQTYKCRGLQ